MKRKEIRQREGACVRTTKGLCPLFFSFLFLSGKRPKCARREALHVSQVRMKGDVWKSQ
jgi:hypothetical protein